MSMGFRGLGLATIAAFSLFAVANSEPLHAASAALSAVGAEPSFSAGAEALAEPVLMHHRRRVQSFYCYPRNYWWFYRPYTTGLDGHARCMPYFNYLGPYEGRARPDGYVK
jgi:hypothetical protein